MDSQPNDEEMANEHNDSQEDMFDDNDDFDEEMLEQIEEDGNNPESGQSEPIVMGSKMEDLKKYSEHPESVLTFKSSPFHHTICVDLNDWSKPHPAAWKDIWDQNHVRMPCSLESMYPKLQDTGNMEVVKRWPIVTKALSKDFKSSEDIEEAILEYNKSDRWDFAGLHFFFNEVLDEEGPEREQFLDYVLPGMAQLACQLREILTSPLPLLKKKKTQSITLSQLQISSLLANAFFCTFPKRNAQGKKTEYSSYPTINFNRLFGTTRENKQIEKLKCLFHYFRRRLDQDCGQSVVTFTRRCILFQNLPDWRKSTKKLKKLRVSTTGTIEDDGEGLLQVDFANAFVGGGVLGNGCVQEEIRFIICPELLVSRLFTERLEDNEVLVISGFERYSKYEGYASTFEFAGKYQDQKTDPTPGGSRSRIPSFLVAMDAVRFSNTAIQFREDQICRELNKAYVGFFHEGRSEPVAVATGNWGCGAFRGDPQLKSLTQLMAAAENGRDVVYFTFGDEDLTKGLFEIHEFLTTKHNVTVGTLYEVIVSYWKHYLRDEKDKEEKIREMRLFDFIKTYLDNYHADTDNEEDGSEYMDEQKAIQRSLLDSLPKETTVTRTASQNIEDDSDQEGASDHTEEKEKPLVLETENGEENAAMIRKKRLLKFDKRIQETAESTQNSGTPTLSKKKVDQNSAGSSSGSKSKNSKKNTPSKKGSNQPPITSFYSKK